MFAGKLMSALLPGLQDRSSAVQKQYAFALGHLVRVTILPGPFGPHFCPAGSAGV